MSTPLAASLRAGIISRELDRDTNRADLRALLALPAPISINEAYK